MTNAIAILLEDLERARAAEREAESRVKAALLDAFAQALKPGAIVSKPWRGGAFGAISTVNGNDHNASSFEIVGKPGIREIPPHPCLTKVYVDAYPLNAGGKRLSARTARGHLADHARIAITLARDGGPDDTRSSTELLLAAIEYQPEKAS